MRVGVIGKLLKRPISIHTQGTGPDDGIRYRVRGDCNRCAIRQRNHERFLGTHEDGLQTVMGLAQVYRVTSHISDLEHPVVS